MIYPNNNETQTRWGRGDLHVQLVQLNNPQPIGFCDGTDADKEELISIAEAEGAEDFCVRVKTLKTGREIWTLG